VIVRHSHILIVYLPSKMKELNVCIWHWDLHIKYPLLAAKINFVG